MGVSIGGGGGGGPWAKTLSTTNSRETVTMLLKYFFSIQIQLAVNDIKSFTMQIYKNVF